MGRTWKIGTRTSPLALKQVEEVIAGLKQADPDSQAEVMGIDTYGDHDQVTPISQVEGTDFFTRELDQALLKGEVDLAVHSAKDLPDNLPLGLTIAVLTPSVDPYDVLVSKSGLDLERLPRGAKIGTSSLRRKVQLKRYRDDFEIVDLRGNIEQRLAKLDQSDELAAIVVAAAGLVRLSLEQRITQKIPFNILRPHPLQGCLAVVTKGARYAA